jgi:hypothetical protein
VAVAAAAVMWWVPDRAGVFADLAEAAYDLHRGLLYKQLRWPLPDTPDEERLSGELLTQYVWRGTSPEGFRFAASSHRPVPNRKGSTDA